MSEYTTVYLRSKATPLLDYREQPSWEEIQNLSEDELNQIRNEIKEHNKNVDRSLGCELFYLSTTPSRHLNILHWSPSPKNLTTELLDEVLEFYNEEIEDYKKSIAWYKATIAKLETRILKANVELYDKISKDIDEYNESIGFLEEDLENKQYLYNKFYFAKGILDNKSNADDYELVYTKC
ncbi:MAG: hypothetical protein IKU63_04930 [Bacteroidaceae bacterium]|nr:hypothetical protein [Bacteroidaceae bacterium]